MIFPCPPHPPVSLGIPTPRCGCHPPPPPLPRCVGLPVRAHIPRVRRISANLDREHLQPLPRDVRPVTARAQHPDGAVFSAGGRLSHQRTSRVGRPGEPRPAVPPAAEGAVRRAVRAVGERRGVVCCVSGVHEAVQVVVDVFTKNHPGLPIQHFLLSQSPY